MKCPDTSAKSTPTPFEMLAVKITSRSLFIRMCVVRLRILSSQTAFSFQCVKNNFERRDATPHKFLIDSKMYSLRYSPSQRNSVACEATLTVPLSSAAEEAFLSLLQLFIEITAVLWLGIFGVYLCRSVGAIKTTLFFSIFKID